MVKESTQKLYQPTNDSDKFANDQKLEGELKQRFAQLDNVWVLFISIHYNMFPAGKSAIERWIEKFIINFGPIDFTLRENCNTRGEVTTKCHKITYQN